MRVVIIFVLFLCLFQTSLASESEDKIISDIGKIIILVIESFVQHLNITIPTDKYSCPNSTNICEGSVSWNQITVDGLDGLEAYTNRTVFDIHEDTVGFGLNISIPKKVSITINNYTADLGLVDWIPVYGNGDVMLSVASLHINFLTNLTYANHTINMTNLELKPIFGNVKINLTGFWNNDEFSNVIGTYVPILLDALEIIWDNEVNCFSCVVGVVVKDVVNHALDLNTIWAELQSCKDDCHLSKSSMVRTAFSSDLPEFIEQFSEDNIISYINQAAEYFSTYMESQL